MAASDDLSLKIALEGIEQIRADLNKLKGIVDSGLKNTSKQFELLSKKTNEAAQEIPGVGRALSFLKNPLVIAGAGLAGLVVGFGKVVSAAAEFNHEFLQLQNLNFDKSVNQIKDLNDVVLKSALSTGQSAVKMSTAFFDFQSLTGTFGAAAAPAIETIAKFSTATGTDFNVAVNSALKAMKAFKLDLKDMDKFLASTFAAVQLGKTTFDELSRVQVTFAASAAGAGQSLNEANKIYTAFTTTSKSAEEAATLTKTAFDGLSDPKVAEGIQKQGVALFDAQGNMRGISDILADLQPKLSKMSGEEFQAFKGALGGPEGIKTLMNQVRNEGEGLIKTFKQFDETTKNFDLDKLLENAKGDFTTLKEIVGNQINTLFITLGQKILPPIARVLRDISDAITLASTNTIEFHKQFPKLAAFVDTVTTAFKFLQIQIKAFIDGMSKVGTAIEAAIGTVFSGQFLKNANQQLALTKGQVAYAQALDQVRESAAFVAAQYGITGDKLKEFTDLLITQNVPLGKGADQYAFIAAEAIKFASGLRELTPEMQAQAEAMAKMTEEQKKWNAEHPAGSIALMEDSLQKMNAAFVKAADDDSRRRILSEVVKLQKEIDLLRFKASLSVEDLKLENIATQAVSITPTITTPDISNAGEITALTAMADAMKGVGLGEINNDVDKLSEGFTSLIGKIIEASDSIVGFGEEIGSAMAMGMSFGEALGSSLKNVLNSLIPLALKYLGLTFLNMAMSPTLPFPANVPFAIAGVALLGMSGVASGLLNGGGKKESISGNVGSFTESERARIGTGLSDFQSTEFRPEFRIVLDGKELYSSWVIQDKRAGRLKGN